MHLENVVAGLIVTAVVLLAWMLAGLMDGGERRARKAGLYPAPGAGTDADVSRLLDAGEKRLAAKLYRELYQVDMKSAQAVVEQMTQAARPNA